ncbi:MAG: serine/threonine protein kinase, partial [Planctomycetes bacterium]|nr:serine/threonine protein kinase [Planctomycetota bacterium]
MSEERDFTPEATHLESDEVRALPSSGFGTIPDDDSGPPATVIESDEVRALPSWPNHASSGDDSGTATLAPPRGRPTEPGSRIGPYEIRTELARGGIGAVYRAYDPELEREVALKVLLSGVRAGDQELLRFRREAKAAARLLHPGIVAVHDVGEDQGLSYMVMDLIEGESLRDKIKREKTLPSRVAAGIGRDLALAVSHAHGHGILHRDLKPANVLLAGEEGRPLITDFGLAKDQRIEEHLTRTGAVLGTPAYMPPEQARGLLDELDARVDVYALGATLYHALAGRPPFDGRTALQVLQQVLREEPPPLSGVDRDLKTICLRCLEKDKDARYASAQALADDL